MNDASGASVTTFSLAYLAGSQGTYRGVLPASVTSTLTEGATYLVRVAVTESGAQQTFAEYDIASYTMA
jgi:hypothetical protein